MHVKMMQVIVQTRMAQTKSTVRLDVQAIGSVTANVIGFVTRKSVTGILAIAKRLTVQLGVQAIGSVTAPVMRLVIIESVNGISTIVENADVHLDVQSNGLVMTSAMMRA